MSEVAKCVADNHGDATGHEAEEDNVYNIGGLGRGGEFRTVDKPASDDGGEDCAADNFPGYPWVFTV